MGLFDFLDSILGVNKNNKPDTKKKQNNDDFDWETHCENCGELLEDCVCDDKELSLADISLIDMIDEDDEEAEKEEIEKEEDDNLSFDNFDSLDDDDDEDW